LGGKGWWPPPPPPKFFCMLPWQKLIKQASQFSWHICGLF